MKFLNKNNSIITPCDNLPLALKKKRNIDCLELDFGYLTKNNQFLPSLQKGINYLPSLKKLNLILYKNNLNSKDTSMFFDGLRGMPSLMTLDLNISK